jgi:hypothetical protein
MTDLRVRQKRKAVGSRVERFHAVLKEAQFYWLLRVKKSRLGVSLAAFAITRHAGD